MDKDLIILFVQGNITNWKGLPKDLLIEDLITLFNNPLTTIEDSLGYYPAIKYGFAVDNNKETLIAYVRQKHVILIETKILPNQILLNQLPKPDVILPNEILIENAYAAEYIYCEKGLNLTIAKYFNKKLPDKIIRCRGFEKINNSNEFDGRYYKSFDDLISW